MFAAMMIAQDDGLTGAEVLHNIPHDVPALVIYAMLVVFVVLIWRGSRQQAK